MYRIVHVFLGLSTGLLICSSLPHSFLCGLSGALGGYIPDIGHVPFKRGKFSHSLVIPVTVITLTYCIRKIITPVLFIYDIFVETIVYMIYSLFIGWITHVLSDALTSQGVYILYPFINHRLRVFKRLRSNSIVGNISILFISALIIYVWLIKSGLSEPLEYFLKTLLSIFS